MKKELKESMCLKAVNQVELPELFMRAEKVNFNRDIDESYAGGFWDLSYEIAVDIVGSTCIYVDTQGMIYDLLWSRYEQESKKILMEEIKK